MFKIKYHFLVTCHSLEDSSIRATFQKEPHDICYWTLNRSNGQPVNSNVTGGSNPDPGSSADGAAIDMGASDALFNN